MVEFESTDRYQALSIPYPDPATMCSGPCEGIGVYPEDDQSSPLWQEAHAKPHDEPCDGWHFVKCSDCGGTGKHRKARRGD